MGCEGENRQGIERSRNVEMLTKKHERKRACRGSQQKLDYVGLRVNAMAYAKAITNEELDDDDSG